VAALIVILSVMNGFEGELRDRLLSLNAQAHVTATGAAASDGDSALRERLQRLPGVVGVAPYMELTALAVRQPEMLPVVLRGIDPALEAAVADVRRCWSRASSMRCGRAATPSSWAATSPISSACSSVMR